MTLPSGKGLNVARAALALGSEIMTTGLVAGQCGQWIRALLEKEGIPERFIDLPDGESRISTIIVDARNGQTTVVNDLGPTAPPGTWPEIRLQLGKAVAGYPWVALAGSSLPGLPSSVYADLCYDIQARGQRVCLDTRDQWLACALSAQPYLVKCNQYEAARVLGRALNTPEQARDAVRGWMDRGVKRVIVTLGRDGAVAAEGEAAWHIEAPSVRALCPIGSGDAMMAGLIVALDREKPLPKAVQYGVALGAANTLVPGSGRCDLDILPRLLCRTTVRPL